MALFILICFRMVLYLLLIQISLYFRLSTFRFSNLISFSYALLKFGLIAYPILFTLLNYLVLIR